MLNLTKQENAWRSVIKFFTENTNINAISGLKLVFDKGLPTPDVFKTSPPTVVKWLSINIEDYDEDIHTHMPLLVYVCTRQDNEGFELARIRDILAAEFVDETKTDGAKRIPIINSSNVVLTYMSCRRFTDSKNFDGPNGMKYKMVNIDLFWCGDV